MGYPYNPDGSASNVGDGYSGYSYEDPGSQPFANFDASRLDVKYFADPTQNNVLGLWQAAVASNSWRKQWTCLAGLNVGDPVYVSAADTVSLALATTTATSVVVGFVRYKPTTTTCYLGQFSQASGLTGTAGQTCYLQDDGSIDVTPGTVSVPLGVMANTEVGMLSALTYQSYSGYSGYSGVSGFSGFTGISGISGFTGQSGTSGYSGPSGISGFSGTYSGYSGFSAESGVSGFSGTYSGYSGASGVSGSTPTVNYLFISNQLKTANETRTSSTLADDADLQVSLAASTRYKVKLFLNVYSSYNGNGSPWLFKMTYSGTASDSQFSYFAVATNVTGAVSYPIGGMGSAPVAVGTQWYGYTYYQQYQTIVINGYIQTTTAGTLKLQWASVYGYNNIIYEGSNIEVMDDNYGALAGEDGASGVSGFSGTYSGYSGVSGAVGPQGDSGVSGFSGTYSGFSGTSGFSSTALGASGYSGFSGISGISAYSGGSGRSGMSGLSGYSGQGQSGYSGAPGSSGVSGFSGEVGATGVQGDSGVSGYSGRSGYSGASGYSGQQGSTGSTGAKGDSGVSGFSGQTGPTGSQGTSGVSGFTGTSGQVGSQGTSGYSGFSGTYSGFSGAVGAAGPTGDSGTSGYSGQCTHVEVLQFVVDGGGLPLDNGVKGYIYVPYDCTISSWTALADVDGDLEVEIWMQTYAGFPPVASDKISGSTGVVITDAQKATDSTLSGWTKVVAAGSVLAFYVVESSCITRATVALTVTRS